MDPERWHRLEQNIRELLRATGAEGEHVVRRLRSEDSELYAEAQSYLAWEQSLEWEDPGVHHGSLVAKAIEVGDRIAGFEVVDTLGQGGMGVVYLAEQEEPRRRVALKVLVAEFASDHVVQRFRTEINLLARLNHPNVAQIHEAGELDDGSARPYFAMEYVPGSTLIDHCQDGSIEWKRRLRLLIKICDAVQHAHARGVLHRDLKPSNIVVDPAGEPKLLDFGVARLLDQAERERIPLRTRTGQVVGTLAYMSPEQAAGDGASVDTRTDIFALGLVGYELLGGRQPRQLEGSLFHEALDSLQNQPLPAFGREYSELPPDLGVVIDKAVALEPKRRYQSASELRADLQRVLDDEPIAARRSSVAYQCRRAMQRHRVALLVVLVASVGGLAAGTAFVLRALEIERRAWFLEFYATDKLSDTSKREYFEADQFAALIREIERQFSHDPKLLMDVFDIAARRCIALREHAFACAMLDRARKLSVSLNGPSTRHTLYLARFQCDELRAAGRSEKARSLAEHYVGLVQSKDFDPKQDYAPEESLFRFRVVIAGTLADDGNLEDSRDALAFALDECQLGESHPDLANTRLLLAFISLKLGDVKAVEENAALAFQLNRTWQGLGNSATLGALWLATWGSTTNDDLTEAEIRWGLLDQIIHSRHTANPTHVARAGLLLADLRRRQGRKTEALQLFRNNVRVLESKLPEHHWQRDHLGAVREALGLVGESASSSPGSS